MKWIIWSVNVNQSNEVLRSPGHGEADHARHHGPGVHPDPELQCVARPVRDPEVLDGGEQLDGEGGDVEVHIGSAELWMGDVERGGDAHEERATLE